MRAIHLLRFLLLTAILLVSRSYVPIPSGGMASPMSIPDEFPKLGAYINIWTDAKQNINQAVVYNPGHNEYLVVWSTEQDEWSTDLWVRRVRSDGSLYPQIAIAVSAGEKLINAGAAYSPQQERYFVVFEDPDDANPDDTNLSAVIFDYDGGNLSGFLSVDDSAYYEGHASVAYNTQDDEFLVVYENNNGSCSEIYGRRFSALTGLPLDSAWPIRNCAAGIDLYTPHVAYNPERNNYLVAYEYVLWDPLFNISVDARVASSTLNVIGPEYVLSQIGAAYIDLDAAAGRDEYLVVWSFSPDQAYARRVNPDGSPAVPGEGFQLSSPSSINGWPRVAATNQGYWVVWQNLYSPDPPAYRVYGNFVPMGADLALSDEFQVDAWGYDTNLGIACRWEGRCLVTDSYNISAPEPMDIHGRFMDSLGFYLPLVVR